MLLLVDLEDNVGCGLIRDLGVPPTPVPVQKDEIPTALGVCDLRLVALLLEEVQPTVADQLLTPLPSGFAYILVIAGGGATLVVRQLRRVTEPTDA